MAAKNPQISLLVQRKPESHCIYNVVIITEINNIACELFIRETGIK